MKKRTFWDLRVLLMAMLICGIGGIRSPAEELRLEVPGAVQTPKSLKFHSASNPEMFRVITAEIEKLYESGVVGKTGISNASFNLVTGQIWLTTICDPSTSSGSYSGVNIRSGTIKNTGSSTWKNVTIKIKINIIYTAGIYSADRAYCYIHGVCVKNGVMLFKSPSILITDKRIVQDSQWLTYYIDVKGVDLGPGDTIQGMASVYVQAYMNYGASVYAKIESIKINLQD